MVETEEINYASIPPTKIDPKEWTLSVYRSCEGGGTGQEFYTNLQKKEILLEINGMIIAQERHGYKQILKIKQKE